MQGEILGSAIPSWGFASQAGVLQSILHSCSMFDSTALVFKGRFWEFFTLTVDPCHVDCCNPSENECVLPTNKLLTNDRVSGCHRAGWSSRGRQETFTGDAKFYSKLKSANCKGWKIQL